MADAPLRILIVDDEAPSRRRLRDLFDDCAESLPLTVVGEAANGVDALEVLHLITADLVVTDIRMPDMDGIELARHLLKLPQPPVVIFTTAYQQHALEAFEVNAIDYLVKPVRAQRLLAALQKVPRLKPISNATLDRLPANARRFLSVTERSRVVLIPFEEIVYLKAELKYITIRTPQREFLLEESLTRLEDEVRPSSGAHPPQLPCLARAYPRLRATVEPGRRCALGSAVARHSRVAAGFAPATIHRARNRPHRHRVTGNKENNP
jgi:two-component system response regulator AlgR